MKIRKFTKLEKALMLMLATIVVVTGCAAGAQAYQNEGAQLDVEIIARSCLENNYDCFRIVILEYNDPETGVPVTDLCRTWESAYKGGVDCERLP